MVATTSTASDRAVCGQADPDQESGGHAHPKVIDKVATPGAVEQISAIRAQVKAATDAALLADADYRRMPLSQLNKAAAALQKLGDNVGAVAAYGRLFRKVQEMNLCHAELHVCHSNRAAAYLKLGLFEEALWDAECARKLAQDALKRSPQAFAGFVRTYQRKGAALIGLGRHREAATVLDEGLTLDPFNFDMKLALEEATRGIFKDLLDGKGKETLSLQYVEPKQRITYHPYSAPLHKIKTDDMLPLQLLSPFQAESDHHVRDTYNYMTVQTDVRMPKRQFHYLNDSARQDAYERAITAAVDRIRSEDKDCRVLNLGAGAGLHAMMALRAGAYHVTAAERWLYLSLACKESLVANGFTDQQFKVVYKRPTDLALLDDVPICCNLLICDILDDGLLSSGIIPAVRHALDNLLASECIVLPASATVYVQAVEFPDREVCGLKMGAINRHRWHPAYTSGTPLAPGMYSPLSEPVEAWHFDMLSPPEESERKTLDLTFVRGGVFGGVVFWYKLRLFDGIELSTGPEAVAAGLTTLRPAVQYLPGTMRVESGNVLPLLASHNTVRMRFDMEQAEYMHLAKPDASFPANHFSMLVDEGRNKAYLAAIERAVNRRKAEDGEAHVLDLGCGTGLFAMMAAKAGADSVVACDLHESLCHVARKAVAANGLSERVSVVERDIGLLERGREVRRLGANIAVADFFDAGLLGNNFTYLLELAKKNVLQPNATVVPGAATLYCMGVEALTKDVAGFDFSAFNKYRWDKDCEACLLDEMPHRPLTKPAKVFEYFFDGLRKGRGRENIVKLETTATGTMNAIAFWFDLHLDDEQTITTAPSYIAVHGRLKGGDEAQAQDQDIMLHHEAKAEASAPGSAGFVGVEAFCGAKPGYYFSLGLRGLGYYSVPTQDTADQQAEQAPQDQRPQQHYWGQALQYLERSAYVIPGKKITLLAKRDGGQVRFNLRAGVGTYVDKAPWKIEWGGGSSVENPHYQRVHYCELLVREFLQRVRCKRFPSIEKDMKMVLAHCGSLFLDPAALAEVYHEMVVLEKIHGHPQFCPGASLEAMTSPALRLH
ncbi:hypothetical protein WJX72_003717 [[Myrmecia] bisecta]|uniref:Methyltransferase domain-containing protein n=1 Tax=[Myrmecia] bisecta TaxID=41462 RepID=A0AAW1Q4W2_9CHLO